MKYAIQSHQEREFVFDDIHFRFLAALANAKTGIVLPDSKKDMVYGRLVRRLRALNLQGFAEYCDLLTSDKSGEEIGQMVNAITTNLTRFFREKHHFEHLSGVLTELASAPRIRLWSAGCSSGMEPYSMAMTILTSLPDAGKRDIRILATDIDSDMLHTAAKGEYPASDVEEVPSQCKKYIQRSDTEYVHMDDKLKQLIAFKALNLLDAWPMKGPFDAIFCRNVVIYFDTPTKEELFGRMAELLKPGGWLYIGYSESLHGISDRFKVQGRTIYRRVK